MFRVLTIPSTIYHVPILKYHGSLGGPGLRMGEQYTKTGQPNSWDLPGWLVGRRRLGKGSWPWAPFRRWATGEFQNQSDPKP